MIHDPVDVRHGDDLKPGDEVYYRPLFGRDVPATVEKLGKRVSIRVRRGDVAPRELSGDDSTKVISVERASVRKRR